MLWGCVLSMSNQMSTCVTGFPLFSRPEWPMSGFRKSERKKQRLLLIAKKEKKKGKESWSVRVFFFSLTLRLESRLRKGSYRRTEQSAWWQEGKMRGEKKKKKYKNNVHRVRLIEKLQKAIMIVRMCRPLVLAASKHHKSCGGLCLHCVDLPVPSGPGWSLRALSPVDIHTHGGWFIYTQTVYMSCFKHWLILQHFKF